MTHIIYSKLLFANTSFDGCTAWPFIFIRESAKNQPWLAGLIAHEEVHYKRMAWITPIWLLRYWLSSKFRVAEEVLAYKESVKHGMDIEDAAWWLRKYGSTLDVAAAKQLLEA